MSEVNGGLAQLDCNEAAAVAAMARRDAAEAHAASYRCSECAAVAVVDRGAWVRVAHSEACSRRRRVRGPAVTVRRRRRLAACASAARPRRPQPPSADHVPAAETETTEPQGQSAAGCTSPEARVRHANRRRRPRNYARRHGSYTRQVRTGVRAGLVARWFVSGCRVTVQGWAATCRRIVRQAGRLLVYVDFDDGWEIDEPFDIVDLAAA